MTDSDGRRLSLCEEAVVFVAAWGRPVMTPVKRPFDDDVDGSAFDENERRPVKGLGEIEVVLLRFRWWRFVLL